MINLMGNK